MPGRQKQSQRQTVIVNIGHAKKKRAPRMKRASRASPAIMIQQVIPPIPLGHPAVPAGPGPEFAQQLIRAMAGIGEGIVARLDRPLAPQISLNNPNLMREVQTVETAMGKMPFKAEEESVGYMDLLGKFGRGAMNVGSAALSQMGQMITAMEEPSTPMGSSAFMGGPSLGQVPMTPKPAMESAQASPRIVLEPQYLTAGGKGSMEEAEALAGKKPRTSAEQLAIQEAIPIIHGVTSPMRPSDTRGPGKDYKKPQIKSNM